MDFPKNNSLEKFKINYIEALKKLSPREVEVLEWTIKEYTNKEISEKLYISTRTVQKHRENISNKLGLKGRNSILKWYTNQLNT